MSMKNRLGYGLDSNGSIDVDVYYEKVATGRWSVVFLAAASQSGSAASFVVWRPSPGVWRRVGFQLYRRVDTLSLKKTYLDTFT